MTRNQVKEILDRVLSWPPERQADVADVVTLMEAQDKSALQLTDEQAAEVRRRLADPNPRTIPAEDVFGRVRAANEGHVPSGRERRSRSRVRLDRQGEPARGA